MSSNFSGKRTANINDILSRCGYDATVDEWIFHNIPCVLLYKDGDMDVYPVQEYTECELSMLQGDSSYKSAWTPIGYGNFLEMQERMHELLREKLIGSSAKASEMK